MHINRNSKMSEKLKELEKEIVKLIDKNNGKFEYIQKAIYLGMSVANEISKNGFTDYKIKCLEDRRSEEDKKEKFYKAKNRINELLLTILRECVRAHIKENGSWDVGKKDYNTEGYVEQFDDEIANKYNIQYLSAELTNYGGDFELNFEVTGELKELLEKHNIQHVNSTCYKSNFRERYW